MSGRCVALLLSVVHCAAVHSLIAVGVNIATFDAGRTCVPTYLTVVCKHTHFTLFTRFMYRIRF